MSTITPLHILVTARRRTRWWAAVSVALVALSLAGRTDAAQSHSKLAPSDGRALALRAGDPQFRTVAMGAWNGTKLLTAQVDTNGNLYAYAQATGATSWSRELVETEAGDGGRLITEPWIVATSTAVQIVAIDTSGRILFWHQTDGSSRWSAPQLVAKIPLGSVSFQTPRIAWTGVPGHAGTNSVITDADEAGNVLFFYQNGTGGWTKETVATASPQNAYYPPAVTATNSGIVLVAPGTNGALYSFYQPYGGSGWNSDGTIGANPGQQFTGASVTWDGVNVDVVAAFNDGSGGSAADKLVFAWKPNSARFWNHINIVGPSSTQPLASTPAIYRTAGNLIIAATQQLSSSIERLDFWWQGSTFTNFNFENVATTSSPSLYGPPTLVSTTGSTAETVIFAPFTADGSLWGLDDWTQPIGKTGWTRHTVA